MNASPRLVAVIGAGLSGLSCATALASSGSTVHVLDKSRGASGRMSTRRGADERGTWQCDHGAQYFTARDPAFRAEVARWQAAGVAAPWSAQLSCFDGQRWSASSSTVDRFVGTPRMTSPAAWLVQEMSKNFASPSTHAGLLDEEPQTGLQTQTTVRALERIGKRWAIATVEHGVLPLQYDAVVLAVPSPQAIPLLRPLSTEAAQLACGIGMRGSWALMLRFEGTVDLPFDGAFINAGPLRWVARDSSKPGRGGPETWLVHASAEWSEAHMEDDAGSVSSVLLAAFAALGGCSPAAPVALSAHRWRYADTDPASAPASAQASPGSWWSGALNLGVCGDWLHGGKVQGAWLSGQHVAHRMLG